MSKKLAIKFLRDELTKEEYTDLKTWLKDPENQTFFRDMVNINLDLDLAYREMDMEKAFDLIQEKITKEPSTRRFAIHAPLKYAAAILVLLATSIGIYYTNSVLVTQVSPSISEKTDKSPQITLQLGDGTVQVLKEDQQQTIKDNKGEEVVSQDYNTLNYRTNEVKASGLVHNTLTVPYGKRFNLELSDGTYVYLNAGTKLTYPTAFVNTSAREVFLDGEAFFEVAENSAHPFIVHTQRMDVRVLGTRFNVSSYKNEDNTSAVLVDGSVEVYLPQGQERKNLDRPIVIAPSQQASVRLGQFSVKEVNVEKHTAWIQGKLYFVNNRFDHIVKEIERHYNIVIENNAPELNAVRYTGTFESETIESVLNTFKRNTHFDYLREGNTITIQSLAE